jgi:hypothetical protein
VLLAVAHETGARSYLDKYDEVEMFKYLLWFGPADRNTAKFKGVWPQSFGDGEGWRGWWDYLTSRKTDLTYSDSRGILYILKK